MKFEQFDASKKQNVFTIGFYNAIAIILEKNFNILSCREKESNCESKGVDFVTESGHCFDIKFTTLDFKSFKKNIEHSQAYQNEIKELKIDSRRFTYITNIIHNDSDEAYATIHGKKIEILTIENLLYLCGDSPVLRTILLGSLNVSTENIVSQPISEELMKELKKDRKLLSPCYLKQFLSETDSTSVQVENEVSGKASGDIEAFCWNLRLKLSSIKKGHEQYSEYENYCQELVDNIFTTNIDKTIAQRKNNRGLYRFDLVASLKDNPESFWKFIYDKFNSCFIVFECKNYNGPISQDEVFTTERYLYNNALRNVAIILTRDGIDENGIKACQDILKEHGKLILVLDDEDVIDYIEAYEEKLNDSTKISPSDLLLKKAKDFLLNLDK